MTTPGIGVSITAEENVSEALEDVADAATDTANVVTNAMGSTEEAFDTAARGSGRFGKALDMASGAGSQLAGGMTALSDGVTAFSDHQKLAAQRADEQKRKLLDVDQAMQDVTQSAGDLKQAQLDLNQSVIDGKQGQIDFEQSLIDKNQAMLDAETAQKAYNDAVKEHGPNSEEAKQAAIDLTQAQADLKQANLDSEQALADVAQAMEDGNQATRDSTQATIDAKGAQLDLNEAQREAKPTNDIQKAAQAMADYAPLIMATVGAIDLLVLANTALQASFVKNAAAAVGSAIATAATTTATQIAAAAQWVWNIAMMANPIGLVIAAVVILIGIIVLIATKTTWFSDLWNWIWSKIGDPVKAVWGFISDLAVQTWNGLVKGVLWVRDMFVGAWKWIKEQAVNHFNSILAIPGKIASAFSSVANAILKPFKDAFNGVARAWNSSVGKFSFTVPDWVPGVGGKGWSIPNMPTLATGGDVMRTGVALIHKGERIVPASARGLTADRSSAPVILGIKFTGDMDSFLAQLFMKLVREGYISFPSTAID
jgi:hypothetical protein